MNTSSPTSPRGQNSPPNGGRSAETGALIPIPWSLRWKLIRERALPLAMFACCAALAALLWSRQSLFNGGWGEVYAPHVELAAPIAGQVLPAGERDLRLYDFVKAGDRLLRVEWADQTVTITAPVDGYITALHYVPGQAVADGTLLTVITPARGQYIVGYVPQSQRNKPLEKMAVTVRTRGNLPLQFASQIERIGPPIKNSAQHGNRGSANSAGIPVRIAIPLDVQLRPGDMVDLQFPTDATETPSGEPVPVTRADEEMQGAEWKLMS